MENLPLQGLSCFYLSQVVVAGISEPSIVFNEIFMSTFLQHIFRKGVKHAVVTTDSEPRSGGDPE